MLNNTEPIRDKIEYDSKLMDEIIDKIISEYVDGLDSYVDYVSRSLRDGTRTPTDSELDSFCLNLSTQIYYASAMCERLGIRDDISKAIYKEVYHEKRQNLSHGTVADKNSIAELEAQHEQLVSICYSRAYKIVKAKVESAQELLGSCKKVVSRRMNEMNLTHIGGN